MTTYPTAEAWNYFTTHLNDIRDVVKQFLPVPQWQSMIGSFGGETNHTLEEFDQAVLDKNTVKLLSIMNDAWGRAPEDRDVYYISGFAQMCNLLDCTVDGFVDDGDGQKIGEETIWDHKEQS